MQSKINAIAAKFATILGDGLKTGDDGLHVTNSATPLTFTNLAFIDEHYSIIGKSKMMQHLEQFLEV